MQEFKQLSEHLYVLTFGVETDRPNLFYIKGKDYSVAIDAGNSDKHVKLFYDSLKEHHLPLPKKTIISHWHWDHTFGIHAIPNEVISSRLTYEKLQQVKEWKWTLEEMENRLIFKEDIPFCHEHILKEYDNLDDIKVTLPDTYIEKETELDLGDIKVILIPRDSTHSRDPIFVYIPSDEALIVEDADNFDFYHGEIYFQDKLKDMISFFENLDYQYHYLGHAERELKVDAIKRLKEAIEE